MKINLLYIVSHPIQYQSPLLQKIAKDSDFVLSVLYEKQISTKGAFDRGFGQNVIWDVPLLEGFDYQTVRGKKSIIPAILKADILWVHGWNSFLNRYAIRFAKKMNVPVLMRGENTSIAMPDGSGLRGFIKKQYLNSIFSHCDGFLCVGQDNRRYYKEHGVKEQKLFSMPYSVDNGFFQRLSDAASFERKELRKKLGLDSKSPVILFAGKLQERKNPHILLEAFCKLSHSYLRNPYLIFVGDGEMREKLQQRKTNIQARIKFLGFKNQTELPSFYGLADVFVLPSEKEPWGLSVNEAMNCETPVIVSDQCGSAIDLVDPSCGRIVIAGSVKSLCEALTDILKDRSKNIEMGKRARQKINTWSFNESISGLKRACYYLEQHPT